MKRTALIGLAVAVAVAVAACGSNSAGTPTAATSAPVVTSSDTAAGGATSSAEPAPSETAASPTESTTGEASQTTESADTGSADTESSDAPTTTLHGSLDDTTTAWFSSFCTNLGPAMQGMSSMGSSMASGDPKAGQAALADVFDKAGDAFTKTAADLSALPPPSIEHGAEIAAKIIAAMGKAGPAYKAAAQKVRAATVNSADDLEKLLSDVSDEAESVLGDFDMGNYDLDPALQKQISAIPACAIFGGN